MPITLSHVGGSGPRNEEDFEADATTTRLRQLCECLLTARAKMLGLSQSFAHRLSSLPPDLKSSLVSGLGEIVAHLDTFEIVLGDTRLTGKARLGADGGMEGHFPKGEIVVTETRGARRIPDRAVLDAPRDHPPLLSSGTAPRRRRTAATEERERFDQEKLREAAREREELDRKRAALARITRKNAGSVYPVSELDAEDDDDQDEVTYGHLYRQAQQRRRQGLNRHDLSRLEHGLLCWVTLGTFGDDPDRPDAPYDSREESLHALERKGYIRRVGKKWGPTPSGFEASGLCGQRGLELDP